MATRTGAISSKGHIYIMCLADAFIQSDLQYIQVIYFMSVFIPWESNPQPLRC